MTRWDVLKKIMFSTNESKALGKAWRLFFFIALSGNKDNKVITSYEELKEKLQESPSTIKKWRDVLVANKVITLTPGKLSQTLSLLPPYDALATCEFDDLAEMKLKSDPTTRRMLDRVASFNNMALLPVVAEIADKVSRLENMAVKATG
jgi:hypothetical protein